MRINIEDPSDELLIEFWLSLGADETMVTPDNIKPSVAHSYLLKDIDYKEQFDLWLKSKIRDEKIDELLK
jgi:hypothetical protein